LFNNTRFAQLIAIWLTLAAHLQRNYIIAGAAIEAIKIAAHEQLRKSQDSQNPAKPGQQGSE
jgi:hypothetical protein